MYGIHLPVGLPFLDCPRFQSVKAQNDGNPWSALIAWLDIFREFQQLVGRSMQYVMRSHLPRSDSDSAI